MPSAACAFGCSTTATTSSRSTKSTFGLTQGFAEYYGTAKIGLPITLVLKGGGAKNYGPDASIPFYKFASIGQNEGLRGYYRNRFSGDASLYYNTELRLALGQVKNNFLPFYYGVFGFYDQGRVYYQDSIARRLALGLRRRFLHRPGGRNAGLRRILPEVGGKLAHSVRAGLPAGQVMRLRGSGPVRIGGV